MIKIRNELELNALNFAKPFLDKMFNSLFLIIMVILVVSLVRGVEEIRRARERVKKAEERVLKLKSEEKELEERLSLVEGKEYVEKQLREKLGMGKEGEIVVILPEKEIVKKFAPRIEEENTLPDPIWKKWAKLFIY